MARKFSISEISRAWLAKVLRNPGHMPLPISYDSAGVTVTPQIPYPRLRQDISDQPLSTRRGLDPRDDAPFYETDRDRLMALYAAEIAALPDNARNAEFLYADLQAIAPAGLAAVHDNPLLETEIVVHYNAVPWRLPNGLRDHAEAAVALFQERGRLNRDPVTGAWENVVTPRLTRREGAVFHCQAARYFDQVGTNVTVDWNSGKRPMGSAFLRDGPERPIAGRLVPLETSVLANTFGTAVVFYDRDLRNVFFRSRNTQRTETIRETGFHCTVSGVLEPKRDRAAGIAASGRYNSGFFRAGTEYEIERETGLGPQDYLLFPVAYARELARAGKPQLFYVAISLVEAAVFRDGLRRAKERDEFLEYRDGEQTSNALIDSLRPSAFTYEAWANAILAEDFLRANEERLRGQVAAALAARAKDPQP